MSFTNNEQEMKRSTNPLWQEIAWAFQVSANTWLLETRMCSFFSLSNLLSCFLTTLYLSLSLSLSHSLSLSLSLSDSVIHLSLTYKQAVNSILVATVHSSIWFRQYCSCLNGESKMSPLRNKNTVRVVMRFSLTTWALIF